MSPNPGTLPLLLEIGCEEIPARFLSDAQKNFGERVRAALEEARLLSPKPYSLQSYSTPRRLVVHVNDVLERQRDTVEELIGPPVKVAFGEDGKPTRAAESFAAKNSAEAQDLVKVSTAKGEYVAIRKAISGRFTLEVLPEIFPNVVTGLSFPKSMYWEKSKTRFIRPIRWLLALLGEGDRSRVIPFEVAGVKSGNTTYGHRCQGLQPIVVASFGDYSKRVRQALVEFDPVRRREAVQAELKVVLHASALSGMRHSLEQSRGFGVEPNEMEALPSAVDSSLGSSDLHVVDDKELEDWIVNSTEWPRALRGSFHEGFLQLPREILTTVMRDHQKYFAVECGSGEIQDGFVAFLNVDPDPKGLIREGHERVLTARFADAEFFWNADQRIPLPGRLPLLKRVTYQAKLGSYGDKVPRMEAIATSICRTLEEKGNLGASDAGLVLRAVQLCKCDLTTQMVQEFTELQGVVGGLYAREQGEPEAVWQAIYDHYLPVSADGQSPRTVFGAVVSIADKLDSVIAGFSAGLEPTGSSDPFGLRRAGNGIIKVSVEKLPGLDLLELLKQSTQANLGLPPVADLFGQVAAFLRERTESYLEAIAGFRYDTVRAVVQSFLGWKQPADALARGRALERIRDSEDFVAVATAAKRTRNILTKSAEPEDLSEPIERIDEKRLTTGAEEELYTAYRQLGPILDNLAAQGQYEEAFRVLAGLRPQVDRFFDKVLVMDDDKPVRRNRLNLLSKLSLSVFQQFADLSQIESSSSSLVDAPTSRDSDE